MSQPEPMKNILISLPESLADRLTALADLGGISVRGLIRLLVTGGVGEIDGDPVESKLIEVCARKFAAGERLVR